MLNTTKIRIYPTTKQAEALSKAFGCARWFWNNSLAEIQKVYKSTGKGLGQFSINARLPALKKEFEWLAEPHSQVLQAVGLNLSRSFVNFFERRANYPVFKKRGGRQSIQYPQSVRLEDGNKIHLPKVGLVKAVIHREILGKIKTVTIVRSVSGKFYAAILTEDGVEAPRVSYDGKMIGIDVGLTHIAVTSNGSMFDNPKHIAKTEKNLKRKQQKLSRKMKGSNGRKKAKLLVAKAYEYTANIRRDFLHKLSRKLVDENQVIAVEDLSVRSMLKKKYLAKSISDVGWGMLADFIRYKAERSGKGFIKVNRFFPSSKTCSSCMHVRPLMPLNVRSWRCEKCGALHNRDVNAAQNIRLEAGRMIAAGIAGTASRGAVSQDRGRKSSVLARATEAGSPRL